MAYPGQLYNTNPAGYRSPPTPLTPYPVGQPRYSTPTSPTTPTTPLYRSPSSPLPYPSTPPVPQSQQTASRGISNYFDIRPPAIQPQQTFIPQYATQQQHQQHSQYLPGPKRKALLIGINYFGTKQELKGCINDVHNIKQFIMQNYGFRFEDMVILTDDQNDPVRRPTRTNIIRAMHWLVADAKPGDSFFIHYSGHGSQTEDLDGDEEDGYDETILPVDFKKAGQIVDDEIHDILVKPLPKGARLTAIFDCCHSGSVLDLPYEYSVTGSKKEISLVRETAKSLFNAGVSYARGDMDAIVNVGIQLLNKVTKGKDAKEKSLRTKSSEADVVQFSGCKDYETAADTVTGGQATGAMSWAFRQVLTKKPIQSYTELLQNVREVLAQPPFHQKPVLSSSHPLDTKSRFVM